MPTEYSKTYPASAFTSVPAGSAPLEPQLVIEIDQSPISRKLVGISGSGTAYRFTFADQLLDDPGHDEEAMLDSIVASHVPDARTIEPPTAPDGAPVVEARPPSGFRFLRHSHDFCDPTTWYQNSLSATEAMSTADQVVYTLPNPRIIVDMTHGKITEEDDRVVEDPTLVPTVTVDSGSGPVGVVESSPDSIEAGAPDGDFVIDYATGTIEFHAARDPSDIVHMSYRWVDPEGVPDASCITIKPPDGYDVTLKKVEMEFSKDAILNGTTVFETYGAVEFFAPSLWDGNTPPGPLPTGTQIPIAKNVYKTMKDFERESQGVLPERDAIGGAGWRGSPGPKVTMVWPYRDDATSILRSSQKMEIRAYIVGNKAHAGTGGVFAVYGTKTKEGATA